MSKKIDSVWLQNFKKEEVQEVATAPVKRAGVCDTCNKGAFTLRMHKHQMLRLCKNCKEVYNPDTNKVIRKGVWENEESNHDVYGE